MLEWLPVKRKDGSIDPYYIQETTKRYRISRTLTGTVATYTVWRGSTAIHYGKSSVEAKEEAYKDSLISHEMNASEKAMEAITTAKELLGIK